MIFQSNSAKPRAVSSRLLHICVIGFILTVCPSCKTREFSRADVKSAENIESITRDADGTFTVVCVGEGEEKREFKKVTAAQIDNQEVCNDSTATQLIQVNPMAFNAFNIWQNGGKSEILDYPKQWDGSDPKKEVDNVFVVEENHFRKSGRFDAVPTVGAHVIDTNGKPLSQATVESKTLVYPRNNGRQLRLHFHRLAYAVTLKNAVIGCSSNGWRLPTARELFDFCAAGVQEPHYGPNYNIIPEANRYPKTANCSQAVGRKPNGDPIYGASFWSATWERLTPKELAASKAAGFNNEKGFVLVFSSIAGAIAKVRVPFRLPQTNEPESFALCVGPAPR